MHIVRSLKAIVAAVVFAAGTVAGTPAWAERGHDRHGYRHHNRGHDHDRGHAAAVLGFGLLAGTALALAMTEPRSVARPAVVYASPPVVYTPPRMTYTARAPIVIARPAPPVYVEQPWWYYCAAPAGYHPYVADCPSGWTRVAPVPPG